MSVLVIFAFLSGIVTILSPCILPVLPVVLSGSAGAGRSRPVGVILGFVVTFTIFTLALSAIVDVLGIPGDALRIIAVVVICLFGAIMIVPWLGQRFELFASKIASIARPRAVGAKEGKKSIRSAGFLGGLALGGSLGLVWTPCVGPIMASVIALSITKQVEGGAALITLAYAAGTAIPMLGVMLGGRALLQKVPVLTRNAGVIQRVFGVLVILAGLSIFLGWDRQFQQGVLAIFPEYGTGLTSLERTELVEEALDSRKKTSVKEIADDSAWGPAKEPRDGRLGDYGAAPEITASGPWLNTGAPENPDALKNTTGGKPVTMADFRGKVVLVDFWTYSCINCIRTMPYLSTWHKRYSRSGLIIIGVHTPEFEFEKKPANVEKAISDLGIVWPVLLDNDYKQWYAYSNTFWPAHYFIDANGRVRYFQFGEGRYDVAEKVIRALLSEIGGRIAFEGQTIDYRINAFTPETYLGYARMKGFKSIGDFLPDRPVSYALSSTLKNGEWGISGKWTIAKEYVVPESEGTLSFRFNARNVYLVAEPIDKNGELRITLDGAAKTNTKDVIAGFLVPKESRLYELVSLGTPGEHGLTIEVRGKIRLFSLTFG